MHKISIYIITLAAMTMSTQALAVGASDPRETAAPQTLADQGGEPGNTSKMLEDTAIFKQNSSRPLAKKSSVDLPPQPQSEKTAPKEPRKPGKRKHRLHKYKPSR